MSDNLNQNQLEFTASEGEIRFDPSKEQEKNTENKVKKIKKPKKAKWFFLIPAVFLLIVSVVFIGWYIKPKTKLNQSVIDLKNKYPDVVGWLTLDGTSIDYPFVQSQDNEDYLRSDLNGDYSLNGSIFTDYRCEGADSFLTVLYGHNMKNGSMFADIAKFDNDTFWDEHTTGMLYLPNQTYQLEIVAFLVVNSTDANVYAPEICSANEISDYMTYIKNNARKQRIVDADVNDKLLVLSTCNYEFTGARSIVIAKMIAAS